MKEVAQLVEMLNNEGENPHYTIGYLEGMLNSLCYKYPEVLEEVISTIDWHEAK